MYGVAFWNRIQILKWTKAHKIKRLETGISFWQHSFWRRPEFLKRERKTKLTRRLCCYLVAEHVANGTEERPDAPFDPIDKPADTVEGFGNFVGVAVGCGSAQTR